MEKWAILKISTWEIEYENASERRTDQIEIETELQSILKIL